MRAKPFFDSEKNLTGAVTLSFLAHNWTPLIPSTFPPDKVASFGKDVPMKRPGQPEEVANSYVFLASDDSSYVSGQILHVNGGEVVNG